MSSRDEVTYKLVSLASGILGGALAGAIFNWIWRVVSGADETPQPPALNHDFREVLVVGALQGAVFGLVKALLGRVTAKSYRGLVGRDLRR